MPVDYRCCGQACPVKSNCARANLWKKSLAPYAAFDVRRLADDYCPQYMPIKITEPADSTISNTKG